MRVPERHECRRQPQPVSTAPVSSAQRSAARRLPCSRSRRTNQISCSRAAQRRCRLFGEREKVCGVSRACALRLAGRLQSMQRVLPHRLRGAGTRWPPRRRRRRRATCPPAASGSRTPLPRACPGGADRLRRREGEFAGEHPQPPEDHALRLGQQGVAPVERGAQRLLAGRAARLPPTSSRNVSSRRSRISCDREDARAPPPVRGRGGYHRGDADLGDDAAFSAVRAKSGATACARATKSCTAGDAAERVQVGQSVDIRQGERGHPKLPFTRDLQGLAARREDAQCRAGGEQMIGEIGAGIDQVLAVVQDE